MKIEGADDFEIHPCLITLSHEGIKYEMVFRHLFMGDVCLVCGELQTPPKDDHI
jgi:hypothetical protein